MYQFRDPIHGFIEVTDLECALIDSPPFQRLRNIKQLATTYLVYHGAEHTRFGHSLGVMYLVTRAFDTVTKKKPELFDEKKRLWYRQILRLIALIHDLGHAPFSHASEELFLDGREHEEYTRDILFNTEIAKCVQDIGYYFSSVHGKGYNITPDLLWLIYEGKDVWNDKYIMPDYKFLKSFMDGALDCDKMDYLIRDSYFCGVKYGEYDIDRLVSSFTVYHKPNENILLLAMERGGIHALEEFILARYFMFIQVYYHKTRRLLDKRLVNCLEKILPDGKYPLDTCDYLDWDDTKVINEAKLHQGNLYADNFLNRKVLSCVYQSDVHADLKGTRLFKLIYKTLEEKILETGISEDELHHYLLMDEVSQPVHNISKELDDDKAIPIIVEHQIQPTTVYEESLVLQGLQKAISIKRIYVSEEFKKIAEDIIDIK